MRWDFCFVKLQKEKQFIVLGFEWKYKLQLDEYIYKRLDLSVE